MSQPQMKIDLDKKRVNIYLHTYKYPAWWEFWKSAEVVRTRLVGYIPFKAE